MSLRVAVIVAFVSFLSGAAGCTRSREHAAPDGVSLRRDIAPVLGKQCASSDGCHGDAPTGSVSLDLRSTGIYAALVGKRAEARADSLLVQAGHPEQSFLVDKLTGELRAREGKQMPIDVTTGAPLVPSPLPAGFLERMLRPWIAAGALDN